MSKEKVEVVGRVCAARSCRWWSPPAAIAAAAVVAIAGCGGDGPGGRTASVPEPERPLAAQLPAFERAASGLECEQALEVVHPVLFARPERPDSRRNCDAALYAMRQVSGFEVVGSEELGTGAIVDGELGGDRAALVWALDAEGTFKWTGNLIPRPQAGSQPASDVDRDTNAIAFVAALRDADCEATFETLAPTSRLSYGSVETFCIKFEETYAAIPEGFGSRLRQDPEAEPVELGATQDVAFYGVATEPAGYRTMVLNAAGAHEVVDVVPAER